MTTRRDFIKKTVAGTAALSLGSIIPGFGSNSYQEILGAVMPWHKDLPR